MKVRSRVWTTAIYSGALVFLPGFLILVTPASASALLGDTLKQVDSSLRQAADRLDRTTDRATNRITEKVVQPLLEELPSYTPRTSSTPNNRQEPLPQSTWSPQQSQRNSSANANDRTARSGQSSAANTSSQSQSADTSSQSAAASAPDDIALMSKPLQPVQPVQPVTVTAGTTDPAQTHLQTAANLQSPANGWIQATPSGWQILNLAWHWVFLMAVVMASGLWWLLAARRRRLAAESTRAPFTNRRG